MAPQNESSIGEKLVSDFIFGNRLLVIDDELAVCRPIQKIAERCGFEVVITDNPETFVRKAQCWKPTVIVLDLQMPMMDGIELLRELAADGCEAHVIVSSGADARVLDAAMQLGHQRGLKMNGILQKPYRAEYLRKIFSGLAKISKEQLRDDLAAALSTDDFYLEYQPKLELKSGRFIGVEALARWRHPQQGLIRPDEFIQLAEESALICAVTDAVVTRAVLQAARWRANSLAIEVAINVSAKDTEDSDLPDRLSRCCANAQINPKDIILELTETGAMRHSLQMMDVLTRCRVKGFRLAIDDFGTGYSSFVQLQRLPFSELKIDQSFVRRMLRDERCRTIVEITIDLARKLGLHSVAEGVEDAATLKALFDLGCDVAQGYYLGRPVSAADVELLVRHCHAPTDLSVQGDERPTSEDRVYGIHSSH